ncbi:NAD(P)H-dependent FMN reductase [Kitasatospora sp. GP30]|uniref:NADPH-dependent FMN reductase n=1 Tax=Kitasatospora sp. GP30 TaxID=3035084 RepID=UPI000C714E68|nr:NAD(P)H-dependent oxidoreductase [Kitasatospora sp. GP30]MDH6138172.1 NAD(P)H-dependent FMN reductase [Kitasatospora sp. GP30]
MSTPLRIAIITGSTRDGRFGPTVADWIRRQAAERPELELDLIDLVETPLPTTFPAFGQSLPEADAELLAAVKPRIAAADAFIVVTPEYNHSFPAPLKNAIDWHNAEWHAKPVGFVSYGGISGGLRAVEQLRLVFAELHAVGIRDTVSFASAWEKFDAEGEAVDPAAATAAKSMLDQLTWWALALKEAKAIRPYGS